MAIINLESTYYMVPSAIPPTRTFSHTPSGAQVYASEQIWTSRLTLCTIFPLTVHKRNTHGPDSEVK